MAASTLIDHWCDQLRDTEELIEHGSPSLRWLRVAYARLYRFLLSAYGVVPVDPAERERAEKVVEHDAPTGLAVDDSVDFRGKRARSAEEIRAALKSVHAAQDEVEAGPLLSGIRGADWIRVASTRDGTLIDEERFLTAAGIKCQQVRVGEEIVLEVPHAQRAKACELLNAWRDARANHPRDRESEGRLQYARAMRRLIPIWVLLIAFVTCAGLAAALCAIDVSPGPWGLLRFTSFVVLGILTVLFGLACVVRWRWDNASHLGD
jgi:hypothetical protein